MGSFWTFAKGMLRYRWLVAGSLLMAVVAGMTLGAGLLGASPILDSILGQRKELPQILGEVNGAIARARDRLGVVVLPTIPEEWIARAPTGPMTAITWLLGGLAVLTLVGSTANFLHSYLSMTIVNRTVTGVRRELFHAAVRSPLSRAIAEGSTGWVSRIVNDTTQLSSGFEQLLSKAVLQSVKGVAGLAAALVFDWRVTVGALVVAPGLYAIIRGLGKRIRRASGAALRSREMLLGAASQTLRSLRIVKVNAAERLEAGNFHRINKEVMRELNRVRTARALASPLTEMLAIFLLFGMVLIAAWVMLKRGIDPGDFILAVGSLAVAGASLKPLTGIVNEIQASAPAAERIDELLRAPKEPGHGLELEKLAPITREIRYRGVGFSYAGRSEPALRDIDLTIRHGMKVAVVGTNGSGKTTLFSLIPRLYDPDQGRVEIDGRDIREVSVRSLRSQIGVVTQETVLFTGTVRSNIAYGGENVTDDRIEHAARRARAHDFIAALPQGYDTPVAEQGLSLSGGQRQRIAIARAILRDPAILILDEATSMIDAESEERIAEAIQEFSKGRTVLSVAHRIKTVIASDLILVMDAGAIVDRGTHDELMQRCELYQKLVRTQLLQDS